jgi:hypothetical protein
VPTGIVTAEIAKSTQNKIVTDKKPCTGCGTEDYPENANFALIVDIRLTPVRKAIHCNSSSHRLYF